MPLFKKDRYSSLMALIHGVALLLLFLNGCSRATTQKPAKAINKDSILFVLEQKNMRNIDSLLAFIAQIPNNHKTTRIILHNELGKQYREKSDFVSAVEQHRKALELAIEESDTVEIIQTYNQLGTDFRRIGSLADAAEAHYEALNISELYSRKNSQEGKRLLSYSLNGIGNVYKSLDIRNEAFASFQRAAELDKQLNNYLGLAMNYVTMGSVLEHQNQLDSALLFYQEAMHYDSLANSLTGIAICHNRIGQLLQKQNKWDEALRYYNVAKEILTERGDVWNRLKTESDMAWVFIQQKRYSEAHSLLLSIRETAQKRKMYGYLEAIQYYLATLYTEIGQYKEANEARKLCLDYRDSIQNIRSEQNVLETRVKFERERGERVIRHLSQINEQEKQQRNLIIATGLIISVLLLGLLIVSYYFIRFQRKRNAQLKEANITKDKFFSIISHDLKNPVIAQRNALQFIEDHLNNPENPDKNWLMEQIKSLRESSESLLEFLNNLLNWARIQRRTMTFKPSDFDLRSMVLSISNLLKPLFRSKNITFHCSAPDMVIVNGDRNMIEIVLRNLITNAVKFSHKRGKILVEIHPHGQKEYKISIIDNGVGLTKEQMATLFRVDKQRTTCGTAGEKGSGLGLIICRELVERNGGVLSVKSIPNQETLFAFTIKRG